MPEAAPRRTSTRRRSPSPELRQALSTTLIATGVDTAGVLPIYLAGAMAVQLRHAIGLGPQQLGLVFASYFAAAALLSTPAGRMTDRVDPARFLRAGCALYIAALLAMAVAESTGALIGAAVVAGVATALSRPTSSVLIARAVPLQHQGLALGLRNCAIPAAALLAGLALPTIALTAGWRWAFVAGAVLTVALLPVLPRSVGHAVTPSAARATSMPLSRQVALAVAAALASAAAVSLGAFTASTSVDAGMSETGAGLLIATGSLVGVGSRLLLGWWTDHRPGSQLDIVAGMMAVGALAYATMALDEAAILWLAVPVAYASGWAFYGSYYLSVLRLNTNGAGAAVGLAQSGSFTGSILGPMVLGAIADSTSFRAAWLGAAVAAAVATTITIVVERGVRRPATSAGSTT